MAVSFEFSNLWNCSLARVPRPRYPARVNLEVESRWIFPWEERKMERGIRGIFYLKNFFFHPNWRKNSASCWIAFRRSHLWKNHFREFSLKLNCHDKRRNAKKHRFQSRFWTVNLIKSVVNRSIVPSFKKKKEKRWKKITQVGTDFSKY